MDLNQIQAILEQNKNKGFVKRILNREAYPTLDLGDGSYATHMMSYAGVDDKYAVFPTVLFDGKGLQRFDPEEAWEAVSKTGNFIMFDTPEEAEAFSKEYKKVWGPRYRGR